MLRKMEQMNRYDIIEYIPYHIVQYYAIITFYCIIWLEDLCVHSNFFTEAMVEEEARLKEESEASVAKARAAVSWMDVYGVDSDF